MIEENVRGFLQLTWEADRRVRLSVVRVMEVPRGCGVLSAEAEHGRRDQARDAHYHKNEGNREPDRLHPHDRRCLGVWNTEKLLDTNNNRNMFNVLLQIQIKMIFRKLN